MSTTPTGLEIDLDRAVRVLREGGVIAMPTDTLYALAAAAGDAQAVARVYAIKGREADKALPLFVSGLEMAERFAVFNPMARQLARRFWPGALTIVLPKQPGFDSDALAGGDTVALRVPDSDIARSVIEALGEPITATSANLSGGADPSTAGEVRRQIGDRIDYLLDGGPCPVGLASTIVDCCGAVPVVLRPGAVSRKAIDAALVEEA
jgi:L-threonylcarbamoyladenylate synthase